MANPVIVNCSANTWTRVSANVSGGRVKVIDNKPNLYLETYRMAGDTAPSDLDEGIPFAQVVEIETTDPIDVYVCALGQPGRVRVDVI